MEEQNKNYFAKCLAELMDEFKIGTDKLAQAIGVTDKQVGNWLDAKTLPDYIALRNLANHFKVSADQLLDTEYTD